MGHSLVGVDLGNDQPDDHERDDYSYIFDSDGQRKYYLAEPTWEREVFVSPWNYDIPGSAVGDVVWQDFSGKIVKVPVDNHNQDDR